MYKCQTTGVLVSLGRATKKNDRTRDNNLPSSGLANVEGGTAVVMTGAGVNGTA